jgi:hypothetical protein
MPSYVLLILGIATLSVALRTFDHVILQKLGALGILVTSYLVGYFLTGSALVGVACAASWLFLPWLEILTRIRRLRLPLEKNLRHRGAPSSDLFPALSDLTHDIEEEGFVQVDDTGWDWDDYQQFFRLFYREKDRCQAAICLIEQHDLAFFYLSISSRGKNDTIWTTWNYPFSYSLKIVPQLKINRLRSDQTFLQLAESHASFLRASGITTDQLKELGPDKIQQEIQKDLRAQIAHNLAQGVLTRAGEGQIRYSWRGFFFIWFQFLRDLVQLY